MRFCWDLNTKLVGYFRTADPAAIRRMLEAEEVADCILFLVSRRASGLTGESIAVDGGLSQPVYL